MAWPALLDNWNSSRTDQRAFLQLGQDIQQGIRLTDGNRHFLLPSILSLFASHEWAYFTSAKLFSLTVACFSLIILLLVNTYLFDFKIALLSVLLTALNRDFIEEVAVKVIAEPIITLLAIISWASWYKGIRDDKSPFFLLAGSMVGLIYLTKGTGQMIMIIFIIWVILANYFKKHVLFFIAAYFIVSTPLLAYNSYQWGNPFYNYNSAQAVWFDKWADKYTQQDTPQGLQEYLAEHSFDDIKNRFLKGAQKIIQDRRTTLLPDYAGILLGLGVALMVYRLLTRQSSLTKPVISWATISMPITILMVWFIFFAWYAPISAEERHFIPLLPLINTLISLFIFSAIGNQQKINKPFLYTSIIILCLIIGFNLGPLLEKEQWNPYESDRIANHELDDLLHSLSNNHTNRVTVMSGPSQLLPQWHAQKYVDLLEIPPTCDLTVPNSPCLSQFMAADYLIIEERVIKRRPFLRDYFTLQDDTLALIQPLPQATLLETVTVNNTLIMLFISAQK